MAQYEASPHPLIKLAAPSRLHVVDGMRRGHMETVPVAKPYYPRRKDSGVPANEEVAGNMVKARVR